MHEYNSLLKEKEFSLVAIRSWEFSLVKGREGEFSLVLNRDPEFLLFRQRNREREKPLCLSVDNTLILLMSHSQVTGNKVI